MFRFTPGARGARAWFPPLEAQIMEALWSRHPRTIDDLCTELSRPWATISTTVNRLVEKGHIKRERRGKKFLYSPRRSREEFFSWLRMSIQETLETSESTVLD